jgi:hypothetical protein
MIFFVDRFNGEEADETGGDTGIVDAVNESFHLGGRG